MIVAQYLACVCSIAACLTGSREWRGPGPGGARSTAGEHTRAHARMRMRASGKFTTRSHATHNTLARTHAHIMHTQLMHTNNTHTTHRGDQRPGAAAGLRRRRAVVQRLQLVRRRHPVVLMQQHSWRGGGMLPPHA